MIAKTNTQHYQNIANEIRDANDYAVFKSELEVDNELFENIGEAIAAKDGGDVPQKDELIGRIEAIPTDTDFDMTVEDNQFKMVVEISENDLSFWTRFGNTRGSSVTIDWGDGSSDSFDNLGFSYLEYAPQRKHEYSKAGRYLITETIENGTLTVGSINGISTLSEGNINGEYVNVNFYIRKLYAKKIKEICFGKDINCTDLRNIPFIKIHSPSPNDLVKIKYPIMKTVLENNTIYIDESLSSLGQYYFEGASIDTIVIPSGITEINAYAFTSAAVRCVDFTSIELNENNEIPITLAANVFNSCGAILLFATKEIAEVAKNSTNWSTWASKIKYVGEDDT